MASSIKSKGCASAIHHAGGVTNVIPIHGNKFPGFERERQASPRQVRGCKLLVNGREFFGSNQQRKPREKKEAGCVIDDIDLASVKTRL